MLKPSLKEIRQDNAEQTVQQIMDEMSPFYPAKRMEEVIDLANQRGVDPKVAASAFVAITDGFWDTDR